MDGASCRYDAPVMEPPLHCHRASSMGPSLSLAPRTKRNAAKPGRATGTCDKRQSRPSVLVLGGAVCWGRSACIKTGGGRLRCCPTSAIGSNAARMTCWLAGRLTSEGRPACALPVAHSCARKARVHPNASRSSRTLDASASSNQCIRKTTGARHCVALRRPSFPRQTAGPIPQCRSGESSFPQRRYPPTCLPDWLSAATTTCVGAAMAPRWLAGWLTVRSQGGDGPGPRGSREGRQASRRTRIYGSACRIATARPRA